MWKSSAAWNQDRRYTTTGVASENEGEEGFGGMMNGMQAEECKTWEVKGG